MTYRGIYRDGIVVFKGDVDLRNGAPVDVQPAARAKANGGGGGTRRKARTSAKAKTGKRPLPGFGAWKHRTDIVDTAEYSRQLRRKTSTRGKRG